MKAICKYIVFKLFIVLIFLILMLKSPFQGRSIKCMYVCINVCTSFPGLRERKSCVNTGIEYLPKGMPVLCIVSFALAVRNKRRTQFFSDI